MSRDNTIERNARRAQYARSPFSQFLSRVPVRRLRLALIIAISVTFALLAVTSFLAIRSYPYLESRGATMRPVPVQKQQSPRGHQDTVRKSINKIVYKEYSQYGRQRKGDDRRGSGRTRSSSGGTGVRLISSQPYGRIGNVMFVFAAMVGVARWTGRSPTLPSTHHFRDTFELTAVKFDRPADAPWWVRFKERQSCAFDDRINRLDDNTVAGVTQADMLELVGYYQSWQYFEHVRDEIHAQFEFRADIARSAQTFLHAAITSLFGANVSRADVTLVGVHVRVRDMASNHSRALGYTIAPVGYLHRAMRYFADRFAGRRVLFVLCTDDPAWVLENNVTPPAGTKMVRRGVKERSRDVEDLATLVSCNHMIMTVGTFGWWAAWLAGGVVVYYKDFPAPGSFIAENFLARDYFYPKWIPM